MSYTICTLNANGLRAAAARGWLRWFRRHKPDYLCLQELRAHPDQVDAKLSCPEGYNTRWVNAEKKGYAGVAIYSNASADRYVVGTGLDWADREARTLRADYDGVSVVSLYVPSGSSGETRQRLKYEFLEHLFEHTAQLLDEDRPIAICGDINIAHTELDIHNPKGNAKNSGFLPEERAWFSRLLDQGWVDIVRTLNADTTGLYSWWSNRGRAREHDKGWRLDYVLCSPSLAARAERAWIQKKANLSDHAPVWVEFADID